MNPTGCGPIRNAPAGASDQVRLLTARLRRCCAVLWVALVLALSLLALPAASQATIMVNTVANNTMAGNGKCMLREAITNANSNSDTTSGDCTAGVGATDTIEFTISGGGSLATIQPTSQLPTIAEGVTIDGTTQGCAGSVPCIELDGTSAGARVDGLVITGSNSTIRGLVINRFGGDGVEMSGAGATGNTVEGNYIGTDAVGTAALGNTGHGVSIEGGATGNMIGGTAAGARNVISGNQQGVRIGGIGATGNLVQGNYIGTGAGGTADLGNTQNGARISRGAANTTIGGTDPAAANTIAFNGQNGVELDGDGTGNAIERNSLFSNGQLGIDLDDDGVTANDPGDGDTGPNNLQNLPDIADAEIDISGDVIIMYSVDTDPVNAPYPLSAEFFTTDANDEEGQVFLGYDTYTSTGYNGCGTPPCQKTINLGNAAGLGVSLGNAFVATATDDAGNTSEFSGPFSNLVTRYVATAGSNAGNDCTKAASPCEMLAHAVDQARASDTIDLAAGTYTEPGLVIDKALHFQGAGVVVQ